MTTPDSDAALLDGSRLLAAPATGDSAAAAPLACLPTGALDRFSTQALAENAASAAATLVLTDDAISALGALDAADGVKAAVKQLTATLSGLDQELRVRLVLSAAAHPLDWASGLVKGFVIGAYHIVADTLSLLFGITMWAGRLAGCIAATSSAGWAELTGQEILAEYSIFLAGKACSGFGDLQAALSRLSASVDEITASAAEFMRHPLDWTTELLGVVQVTLQVLNDALAPDDGALRQQIVGLTANPQKGAELLGVVAINIVVAIIPGGAEAKVAELAGVAARIPMAARAAEAEAAVSRIAPGLEQLELSPEVAALLEALRPALASARQRMGGVVNDRKYQILLRLSNSAALSHDVILLAQKRVFSALFQLRGKTGTITELRALAKEVNAHSQVVYLLELQRQGATAIKAGDTALHSATLAEDLIDAAHIVDARFFDLIPEAARAEFGWTSENEMLGILATASEHRRSWPAYFEKLAGNGPTMPPPDLNEFRSITTIFRRRLVKATAGQTVPDGAVAIRVGMKGSEILAEHLKVWQRPEFTAPGGIATGDMLPKLQEFITILRNKGL